MTGAVRRLLRFWRRREGARALPWEILDGAVLAPDVGHLDFWSQLGSGVAEV